jgi:hypothetical protein
MYINGKMRPIETIPEWGMRGKFKCDLSDTL